MSAPILSQLASQAGQAIKQELSKPHIQAHLLHMAGEIIKNIKKK